MPFWRKYSIYSTTVESWTKILVLAQRWGFKEIEQLCIRELENLPIPPVEKIQIYQDFKIDRSRLLSSFAELTMRRTPLSLEEGQKVGLETALQIARARELSRGAHTKLNEAELRSVIRDTFELEDEFLDFSVTNSFTLWRPCWCWPFTLRRRSLTRRSNSNSNSNNNSNNRTHLPTIAKSGRAHEGE
jgi:hypothetical protein